MNHSYTQQYGWIWRALYWARHKMQVLVREKNIKKEIRSEFVCLGWMGEFDCKEATKLKLVTIQQGFKELQYYWFLHVNVEKNSARVKVIAKKWFTRIRHLWSLQLGGEKCLTLKLSVQFSSVAQSCTTLCDSMDCSSPGFPVHHKLPELAQTHVHWVVPSNHLILYHPLRLPSIFPSIKSFSNESVLHIRLPKYWSFSFSITPSNEYSGLISFRIDRLHLLAVQGTLKSLFQNHSSEAPILRCSFSLYSNCHIHTWLLEKP